MGPILAAARVKSQRVVGCVAVVLSFGGRRDGMRHVLVGMLDQEHVMMMLAAIAPRRIINKYNI